MTRHKLTDTVIKQLYHTCWTHWGAYPQAEDEIGTITHEIDLCDQTINEARECAELGAVTAE